MQEHQQLKRWARQLPVLSNASLVSTSAGQNDSSFPAARSSTDTADLHEAEGWRRGPGGGGGGHLEDLCMGFTPSAVCSPARSRDARWRMSSCL